MSFSDKIGFYKIMIFSLLVSGMLFFGLQFVTSFEGLCFSMFAIMVVAVTIGPAILRWTLGYEYDSIPSENELVQAMAPSFRHLMGTDDAGRDILARVLQGGRISLMVGIISTIVSLIVGVSYGATAG